MSEFGNEEKDISHTHRKQMVRLRRRMHKHNASRLNRELKMKNYADSCNEIVKQFSQ